MSDNIHVLPENEGGEDKWIGDVHGGLTAFKEFLADLKKNDRGICVGDLTDRGEDSLGVIEAIIQHNKEVDAGAEKGKFYSIYGNHEDSIIDSILILENELPTEMALGGSLNQLLKKNSKLRVTNDPRNGGNWFFELFKKEVDQGLIVIDCDQDEIKYSKDSKVLMVREYMRKLPHMIYISGNRPAVGAHADIPISDVELQQKIRTGDLSLTPEQREYAIWARQKGDISFKDTGRTRNSILAFVGHNIVGKSGSDYTPCVRAETNIIDLDVASYYYGILLGVTLPSGEVKKYGRLYHDVHDYPVEFYQDEENNIENLLVVQNNIYEYITEARKCKSLNELDRVIDQYEQDINSNNYDKEALLDIAIRNMALSDMLLMGACVKPGDLERLLYAGLNRLHVFDDKSSIIKFVKKDRELTRVYVQSMLVEAIKKNDMKAAKVALKNTANLFHPNSNGKSPLDFADNSVVMDLFMLNLEVLGPEIDLTKLDSKNANIGLSALHYLAMFSQENDYLNVINNPYIEPYSKIPATLSSSNFDKIIHATYVSNGYKGSHAPKAVLNAFHKKYPANESGYVTVTPQDIRKICNIIDGSLRVEHKQSMFNKSRPTIEIDSATSEPAGLTRKKKQ